MDKIVLVDLELNGVYVSGIFCLEQGATHSKRKACFMITYGLDTFDIKSIYSAVSRQFLERSFKAVVEFLKLIIILKVISICGTVTGIALLFLTL